MPSDSGSLRHTPARRRLAVVAAVGACAGVLAALLGHRATALLAAWDTAAAFFLAWVWSDIHGLDHEQTRHLASIEDAGRASTDALLLLASGSSLAGVGQLLIQDGGGLPEAVRAIV